MVFFSEFARLKEGVFRDRQKLYPEYVPQKLVNRREEYRELVRFFKPVLQSGMSQRVLIHGAEGSGKTALGRRFVRELEKVSKREGIDLNRVYIDCRRCRTGPKIAWKIANANNISIPRQGLSTANYLKALKKHLEMGDDRLVVVIDWIDFHVLGEGSDLLHDLTRLWENSDGSNRLSLIGISRKPDPSRLLDRATRSTFHHNRVKLDRYTNSEIKQILRKRADQAFKHGAVREETLELIAKGTQWQDGVGLAIEWLLHAGIIAAEENDEEVEPEHALKGKARIHAQTPVELLATLNKHELLLLLAYAKKTKNKPGGQIVTGDLWKEYKKVCRSYGEKPRGLRMFSNFVTELSNLQVIKTKATRGGSKGNTREIRIPGASPLILKSVLERLLEEEK